MRRHDKIYNPLLYRPRLYVTPWQSTLLCLVYCLLPLCWNTLFLFGSIFSLRRLIALLFRSRSLQLTQTNQICSLKASTFKPRKQPTPQAYRFPSPVTVFLHSISGCPLRKAHFFIELTVNLRATCWTRPPTKS
jgi:hypothetical protein